MILSRAVFILLALTDCDGFALVVPRAWFVGVSRSMIEQETYAKSLTLYSSSSHKRKKNGKRSGRGSTFGKVNDSSSHKGTPTGQNTTAGGDGDSSAKKFFYADTELFSSTAPDNVPDEPKKNEEVPSDDKASFSQPEFSSMNPSASIDPPIAEEGHKADPSGADEAPHFMADYFKLEATDDPRKSAQSPPYPRTSPNLGETGPSTVPQPQRDAGIAAQFQPPLAPTPQQDFPSGKTPSAIDPRVAEQEYISALQEKMKLLDQKLALIAEVSESISQQVGPAVPVQSLATEQTRDSIPVDRQEIFLPGGRHPLLRVPDQDLRVDSPKFLQGKDFLTGGTKSPLTSVNQQTLRTTPATVPGSGMSSIPEPRVVSSLPVDRADLFMPGSPHPDRYLPGAPQFPTTDNPNLRGQQGQALKSNIPPPPPPPPPPPSREMPPTSAESSTSRGRTPSESIDSRPADSLLVPPPPPPPPAQDGILPDRSDVFLPRSRSDVYLPGSPMTASSGSKLDPGSSIPGGGTMEDRPMTLSADRPEAFLPATAYGGSRLSLSREQRTNNLASDLVEKLRTLEMDSPGQGFSNGDAFASGGFSSRDNRGQGPPPASPSGDEPPFESFTVDHSDKFRPVRPGGANTRPSLTSQQLARIRSFPPDTPGAFDPGPDWKK